MIKKLVISSFLIFYATLIAGQLPRGPSLGVCYYPEQWVSPDDPPNTVDHLLTRDINEMIKMGIEYVRIGEFSWSTIEPIDGVLNWTLFDTVINLMEKHEMKVIMSTPTASPPKWLIDKYGGDNESSTILAVGSNNVIRTFGSRRHYKFTSPDYHRESKRIVELIAKRYGNHPAIVGFMVDNEFGCGDTVRSYDRTDTLKQYRKWLTRHYRDIQELNNKWGTAFWSNTYQSFDEIDLPNLSVSEANPSHYLSFYRFSSDMVVDYCQLQSHSLREYISNSKFITTNFMFLMTEIDHYSMMKSSGIDIPSFDNYPAGFASGDYVRTGMPDGASLGHDIYSGMAGSKGTKRAEFLILEQQAGAINWGRHNPTPEQGMIRLWTHEAFAHGANLVAYFRWKQYDRGHEQFHSGLTRYDGGYGTGYSDVVQVAEELQKLKFEPVLRSTIAMIYSYDANWIIEILPHGTFDYHSLFINFYTALRGFGLDIDILGPGADLQGYSVVIIPSLPFMSSEHVKWLVDYLKSGENHYLLLGPRTGSKTNDLSSTMKSPMNDQLLPDLHIENVESFSTSSDRILFRNASSGYREWKEWIKPTSSLTVKASFTDKLQRPAIVSNRVGNSFVDYFAFYPETSFLSNYLWNELTERQFRLFKLPATLRIRSRGSMVFMFNYGYEKVNVKRYMPDRFTILIGSSDLTIAPHDLLIYRKPENNER